MAEPVTAVGSLKTSSEEDNEAELEFIMQLKKTFFLSLGVDRYKAKRKHITVTLHGLSKNTDIIIFKGYYRIWPRAVPELYL